MGGIQTVGIRAATWHKSVNTKDTGSSALKMRKYYPSIIIDDSSILPQNRTEDGRGGVFVRRCTPDISRSLSLLPEHSQSKHLCCVFVELHAILCSNRPRYTETDSILIIICLGQSGVTSKHTQKKIKKNVVMVTSLVVTGNVQVCLQRLQWWPEQSSWRPFPFTVLECQNRPAAVRIMRIGMWVSKPVFAYCGKLTVMINYISTA